MLVFEKESIVRASARDIFDWHGRAGAFERLVPPWENVVVEERGDGLAVGTRTLLRLSTPLGRKRWLAEHVGCVEKEMFEDVQVEGPFRAWRHRHDFIGDGNEIESSVLKDRIDYELPGGRLGDFFAGRWVQASLEKSFGYRHEITKSDLELHRRTRARPKLKVLIAGGSGFLGSRLRALMESQGHSVSILTRRVRLKCDIAWNPREGNLDVSAVDGCDVLINLVGENISDGRWSAARRKRLWESRVESTRLLVDVLSRCSHPPRAFVSASGVGFYGENEGQTARSEKDSKGSGFLADLCAEWEAEAIKAEAYVDRVCLLRTGVVLSGSGGALRLMARAFRFGVGGRLGSGLQMFPWISLEDWLYGVYEIVTNCDAKGPYNLVSANPVSNGAFVRELARYLKRPAICHVPAFVLKGLLGEMANDMLLGSLEVAPDRLLDELGFSFRYPKLNDALRLAL